MSGYAAFARFYDAVQGDRADAADLARSLLERHHPDARRVLELACGTGSILARLRPRYDVVGVDLSQEMLAVARRKLPGVELVRADMTRVRLGRRFDAVLCLYDSINHLLRWRQWEAVFDRVREHLEPDERIRGSLARRFRRVRVVDPLRARPTVRSGRLWLVCSGPLPRRRP